MSPEISIIVPMRNEAEAIVQLLACLEKQEQVVFEIILVDGASTDGTVKSVTSLTPTLPFSVRILNSRQGRGLQLNAGAAVATADLLLFLHADSLFTSPSALRAGIDALRTKSASPDSKMAGRFRLLFGDAPPRHAGYHFYESKARLGRRGCIHGDQGFLLSRRFFHELGGFAENLPVLEDTLLAERIRSEGSWLLLPADIMTSARRFLAEGLTERQTLNAILMNLGFIGFWEPFEKLRGIYREQGEAKLLDLSPIISEVVATIGALPEERRKNIWKETGAFVRDNAWQLAFALDTRRRFQSGHPPDGLIGPCLRVFDRRIAPLLRNEVAAQAAAMLVKLWAYSKR